MVASPNQNAQLVVVQGPHSDFGESVLGVLVARPEQELDIEGIRQKIGKSLAQFKLPQKLVVVPELPRNTMGKVQKRALREMFSGKLIS